MIVAPSTPIGPRDIKPTPTGRIIVEAATGRMPAFVDTGLNLVHVDDVAQGHLLALDKGKIGENYILGGEDVALQTMLGDIAVLSGRTRAAPSSCRAAPLFPLAWGAEAVARITGKEPFLTADALRMSRYRMFFSLGKGQARTGLSRARPYREGLEGRAGLVRRQRVLSTMIAGILFGFRAAGDLALSAAVPPRLLAAARARHRAGRRAARAGRRWWRWCRPATKPM